MIENASGAACAAHGLSLAVGSAGRVGNRGYQLRTLTVGFMFGQAGLMGRARKQQTKHLGASPLARAVLAVLVERPSHGWEIAKNVNARLEPIGRSFGFRRVYEALSKLEVEGLAWSEAVYDASAPGGMKRVFHATARGIVVCAEWLRASVSSEEPVWEDIQAWMLLSRPEEASAILACLDEWEQDCMEKVEGSKEPATRSRSWGDRMLGQYRASIREKHRWRLRFISLARREIEEYLSQQRR